MTIQARLCPFCEKFVRGHGNAVGLLLRAHIFTDHPADYQRLADMEHEIGGLRKKVAEKFPGVRTF